MLMMMMTFCHCPPPPNWLLLLHLLLLLASTEDDWDGPNDKNTHALLSLSSLEYEVVTRILLVILRIGGDGALWYREQPKGSSSSAVSRSSIDGMPLLPQETNGLIPPPWLGCCLYVFVDVGRVEKNSEAHLVGSRLSNYPAVHVGRHESRSPISQSLTLFTTHKRRRFR